MCDNGYRKIWKSIGSEERLSSALAVHDEVPRIIQRTFSAYGCVRTHDLRVYLHVYFIFRRLLHNNSKHVERREYAGCEGTHRNNCICMLYLCMSIKMYNNYSYDKKNVLAGCTVTYIYVKNLFPIASRGKEKERKSITVVKLKKNVD